jgi:hypothetical protein
MRHFILKSAGALACAAIFCDGGLPEHDHRRRRLGRERRSAERREARPAAAAIGDVEKVDILFMVDNSRSMADKQQAWRSRSPISCNRSRTRPASTRTGRPLEPAPERARSVPIGVDAGAPRGE